LDLQVFEGLIIELELPFERAIGHPTSTLQHGQGLVHNFLEGHGRPSIALALPYTDRRFLQPRDYLAKAPRIYQGHGRMEWQLAQSAEPCSFRAPRLSVVTLPLRLPHPIFPARGRGRRPREAGENLTRRFLAGSPTHLVHLEEEHRGDGVPDRFARLVIGNEKS